MDQPEEVWIKGFTLDKIEHIVGQKDVLNLKKISGTETLSWRPPVTSHVEASEVYGREKEKEDIIKLMFNGEGGQLSVIPIVGMGGVGKTTLVNSVYNDEDVKQKFDFHVWVCVSEVFDLLKIAQTIIKSISPGQLIIKIIHDELVKLLSANKEEMELNLKAQPPACILMAGLQGSGKTTSSAKLALRIKEQNKKVLLVSTDIYRPAAREQLATLGEKIQVDTLP